MSEWISCRLLLRTLRGLVIASVLAALSVLCTAGATQPPDCQKIRASGLAEWLTAYWLPRSGVRIVEVEVNSCADDRYSETVDCVTIRNDGAHSVALAGWYISATVRSEGVQVGRDSAAVGNAVLPPGETCTICQAGRWLTSGTTISLDLVGTVGVCGVPVASGLVDHAEVPGGFFDLEDDSGSWKLRGADQRAWEFVPGVALSPAVLARANVQMLVDACPRYLGELPTPWDIALLSLPDLAGSEKVLGVIADGAGGTWHLRLADGHGTDILPLVSGVDIADGAWAVVRYCPCNVDLSPPQFESMPPAFSSVVQGAWYDRTSAYLVVRLNGAYYHYCNVDEQVWVAFRNAPSKGSFFNAALKGQSTYDCRTHPLPSYVRPELHLVSSCNSLRLVLVLGAITIWSDFEWRALARP